MFNSGDDILGTEQFEIKRVDLTTTSFTVSVQISGFTFIHVLNVRYVAIELTFPHHLNSFDNVPINYTYGPLVNISSPKVNSYRTFENKINYKNQAAGLPYNKFTLPLENNKIMLFMTSFFHSGNNDHDLANVTKHNDPSRWNPIKILIDYTIEDEENYILKATIGVNNFLGRLHFSMIIFNQDDIESSGKYVIEYQRLDASSSGGFIPIPIEFESNFIMGFTNFTTYRTSTVLIFSWEFTTINGITGIQMPISVSRNPSWLPVSQYGFSYFYLKTWICLDQTYFDPSTNLCSGCPIIHCINCLNLTVCSRCDESLGYFLNETSGVCISCEEKQCAISKISLKKSNCNSFNILLELSDSSQSALTKDIKMLTAGIEIKSIATEEGIIKLECDYSRYLASETIFFSVNKIQYSVKESPAFSTLSYYTESECETRQQIKNLMEAMQIMSYLILVISLISCKIVGLELFGVLQLSYFSLTSHDFLVLYLDPLSSFKTFNGLNLKLFPELSQLPYNFEHIGLSSYFFNNCNIMLVLMLVELVIGIILYLVSRRSLGKKLINISQRLLKQGFISFVLFNLFNISYSTGIHIKFAIVNNHISFYLSFVFLILSLIVIIGATIAMQFTSEANYGEFKQKFKETMLCKIYIPFSILYRITLGLYCSMTTHNENSTLLILVFVLFFIIYNLVYLPFKNLYQNYRSNLIHFTELVILFTANYYRNMKKNTPMNIKAHIHDPAFIELVFIVFCVTVSMLVLLYEIYSEVKQWRKKSIIVEKTIEGNPSHESFQFLER